jgi:hypothetical protein
MKKLLIVLFATLFCFGCSPKKPDVKTVLGMYTPYTYFPEVLNGKVMEVKETNFFPMEKDGIVEAGSPLSTADRDSINWTNDFIVTYNASGLVEKAVALGDEEMVMDTWEVSSDETNYTGARLIRADTTVVINKVSPLSDGRHQIEVFDPVTDTLRSKVVFDMNTDKTYHKIQWYNYKGEPTSVYNYTYDANGFLTGYSVSRADTVRGGMNFTRNEKGFMSVQEVYNPVRETSETTSYTYEYDEMGNWTKCVAYQNKKPFMVALREYKYY